MQIILVGLIGLVTSFLSNISGGGGALILLPSLLAIGLEPITAIGTMKVGSIGLVIGSVASTKDKGVVRKEYLLPLILIVAIASVIGPRITFYLSSEQVKIISSVIIIITGLVAILSFKFKARARKVSKTSLYIGYGIYFFTTTVLAGFGSAIGLLSNYILIGLLGMSAVETVSTRRITGLLGTPIQLLAFAFASQINWPLGLSLMAGSIVGGYIGMNTAIEKGNLFIKRAMAVAAIVLVISLFLK